MAQNDLHRLQLIVALAAVFGVTFLSLCLLATPCFVRVARRFVLVRAAKGAAEKMPLHMKGRALAANKMKSSMVITASAVHQIICAYGASIMQSQATSPIKFAVIARKCFLWPFVLVRAAKGAAERYPST